MSTILVPLDGTPLGELALPYAEVLARATGARLLLMHVATPSDADPRARMHAYLDKAAARLGSAAIAARVSVPAGKVAEAILDALPREAVQLLVLVSHPRSGTSRWLHGSVTDPLLLQASVPILLIPSATAATWSEDRVLTIVVALDGSSSSEAILRPALDLANALGAELLLVDVVDPAIEGRLVGDPAVLLRLEQAYLDEVARRLQQTGTDSRTSVELGRPGHTIMKIAQAAHADVLALATHGRGGQSRQMLGSVTTEVLERADIPLLLARPMPWESAS
jgi:nucleotide-binding universal stress UspA family protein